MAAVDNNTRELLKVFANTLIQLGKDLNALLEEHEKTEKIKELSKKNFKNINIADLRDNLPPMLTMQEVGQILRIPRRRLYEEIDAMGIPHKKLSPRRIRIPRDSFLEWLEDNKGAL
ncbi:MAG: helix-turn-helix domain-containing protein [Bacillota bacterium]